MAHSSSRVWVSHLEATHERWAVVRDNLNRVRFDRSPFVPQGFEGYIEHLATQAEWSARAERRRIAQFESENSRGVGPNHPWIIPFEGKSFRDNRSAVLAMPTIWSIWYEPPPNRPEAPWPTLEEFREEGDERHTSGFGRFLPLPRVPGNETVVWKQKAFLEPYALDRVNPVLLREPTPRFLAEEEEVLAEAWTPGVQGNNTDAAVMRHSYEREAGADTETADLNEVGQSVPVEVETSEIGQETEIHFEQGLDGIDDASQGSAPHTGRSKVVSTYRPSLVFFPSSRKDNNVEISPIDRDCTADSGSVESEDDIGNIQKQPQEDTGFSLEEEAHNANWASLRELQMGSL